MPRLIAHPDQDLEIRISKATQDGPFGLIDFEADEASKIDSELSWTLILDDGLPRAVVMLDAQVTPGEHGPITSWRAWFK